ncbi:MAG: DUF3185 family protein [Magnetococcales bacterium]|nr:DUF3185 family protein [Magnetococcales bacterium]
MTMKKTIGIAVFAVGALILWFAYNASQAPAEELANTITGRYSDETMLYFVVGIAATVVGGLLAGFGARR